MSNSEFIYGNISNEKIPTKAISACAINAINRTKGVIGLVGNFTDSISKSVLKKENYSKGVKIEHTKDGIVIDVHIVAEYGHKIPAIAWDVQEKVKKEVEDITEKTVSAVNVHVEKVSKKEI